jgi:hypothetical protein
MLSSFFCHKLSSLKGTFLHILSLRLLVSSPSFLSWFLHYCHGKDVFVDELIRKEQRKLQTVLFWVYILHPDFYKLYVNSDWCLSDLNDKLKTMNTEKHHYTPWWRYEKLQAEYHLWGFIHVCVNMGLRT